MRITVTTVYDFAFPLTSKELHTLANSHSGVSKELQLALNDNHVKGFVIKLTDHNGYVEGEFNSDSIFNKG